MLELSNPYEVKSVPSSQYELTHLFISNPFHFRNLCANHRAIKINDTNSIPIAENSFEQREKQYILCAPPLVGVVVRGETQEKCKCSANKFLDSCSAVYKSQEISSFSLVRFMISSDVEVTNLSGISMMM